MKFATFLATVVALAGVTNGCFWWEPNNNCDENGGAAAAAANPSGGNAPVANTTETARSNPNPNDRISNVGGAANVPVPLNDVPAPLNASPAVGDPESYSPCNNNLGRCVPYYLCREGNIITDGAGLIDIRIGPNRSGASGDTVSSSECPQFLDVCCNSPETEPIPIPNPPIQQKCGLRNEEGVHTRILGFKDNQAQFGEFPWMAAILRKEFIEDKEISLYVCGGSLIHPQVVLTAAHCVHSKDAKSLKVRLGEWDTQRTYELYPHIDRNVVDVVTHPGFNAGALWNDFALLFLETPADLAPNVGTVCLPVQGQKFDLNTCWATGWGRDEFGKGGNYQNVLKEVALPIVPRAQCETALRTTRLGMFFKLDQSFMCAGGKPGLDTCKGDGGSPLVCAVAPNTHTYVQAGIVAWGIGCGENGIPGVYADVAGASDWIIQKADEGLLRLYGVRTTENYWRNYKN
nr:prophenoloxidase activating factor [Macrobrachium nipponense]